MAHYPDSSSSAIAAERPNIFATPVHRTGPNEHESERAPALGIFEAAFDSAREEVPSAADGPGLAASVRKRCRHLAARLSVRTAIGVVGLAAAVTMPAPLMLHSERRTELDPPAAREVPAAPAVIAPQGPSRQPRTTGARKLLAPSQMGRRHRGSPRPRGHSAPAAQPPAQPQ